MYLIIAHTGTTATAVGVDAGGWPVL